MEWRLLQALQPDLNRGNSTLVRNQIVITHRVKSVDYPHVAQKDVGV